MTGSINTSKTGLTFSFFTCFALFIILFPNSGYAEKTCADYPAEISFFFVSEEIKDEFSESFFQQIYCDLSIWNWASANIKFTTTDSLAASNDSLATKIFLQQSDGEGNEIVESDLDSDASNRFTNKKISSRGFGLSRVYTTKICFLSLCGMSYDYLDFTTENGFQLRKYNTLTSEFVNTDILDIKVFGFGASFCLIDFSSSKVEALRLELSYCFIPSYGNVDVTIKNTSGTKQRRSTTGQYNKIDGYFGIGYEGFGMITYGKFLYHFNDMLPENCTDTTNCPENTVIFGTSWAYTFQWDF